MAENHPTLQGAQPRLDGTGFTHCPACHGLVLRDVTGALRTPLLGERHDCAIELLQRHLEVTVVRMAKTSPAQEEQQS